jgi:hypothetical protein
MSAYSPLTLQVSHAKHTSNPKLEYNFENLIRISAAICFLEQEDSPLRGSLQRVCQANT